MKHQSLVICVFLLLASACSPLPEGTVSQRQTAAVTQMEKSGLLPELDRSVSLGGTDVDRNGIRDDIDTWIAKQPYNESQRKAAQQFARALQLEMIIPIKTREEARKNAENSNRAIDCLYYIYGEKAHDVLSKTSGMVKNTRERILKESQNDKLVSGMVFPDVYFGKNPCE